MPSLDAELVSPLAVVACDSGAANQIVGWLKAIEWTDLRICVEGAAEKIFKVEFPELENVLLDEALNGAACLISGTSSVESDIEHKARARAGELRIKSIGVVDHWVNYTQRFVRDGHQVLPDEIWVCDDDALDLAKRCFPHHIIRLQRSLYLEELVEQVELSAKCNTRSVSNRVLYLLEPILVPWDESGIPGEFLALNFFIENMSHVGLRKDTEICLRPHPTESDDKYRPWCNAHPDLRTKIDSVTPLHEQIAYADWVVGCQTFAMVVALNAKKNTMSTLPPFAPACTLPQKGITMLRDVVRNLQK